MKILTFAKKAPTTEELQEEAEKQFRQHFRDIRRKADEYRSRKMAEKAAQENTRSTLGTLATYRPYIPTPVKPKPEPTPEEIIARLEQVYQVFQEAGRTDANAKDLEFRLQIARETGKDPGPVRPTALDVAAAELFHDDPRAVAVFARIHSYNLKGAV